MFLNYKKAIIFVISLFLIFFASSCTTPTLRAISYNDSIYRLDASEDNRFTFINANNEKIICTFSTNIFTYNSFTFELTNDLYKASVFSNSVRITCPDGRILNARFNDKNQLNSLSALESHPIYETDHKIVELAQNIYAARGIKYIGWSYILIIALILVFGIVSFKSLSANSNQRTYNYNRNTKRKVYYGKINYKKGQRTHYNNDYYKNMRSRRNIHANLNKKWYNKEVKRDKNKIPYYILINLFILALIGLLIYLVFYM
ncbi:MAG: hypothetical protein FWC47_11570 [Oscillospiraceae bacterium]|nr:hypothetical protein [Oscillospiraceae bacterium]